MAEEQNTEAPMALETMDQEAVAGTDQNPVGIKKSVSGKKKATKVAEAAGCPAAFVYNRSLHFKAEGEDVKALQSALTSLGYPLDVTGVYDMKTVRAVQALQKAKSAPATGLIRKNEFTSLLK